MNAYFQMSQERMNRMMSWIMKHHSHNLSYCMTTWQMVKHKDVGIRLEGVLISTIEYSYMCMYPKGVYQCGLCEKLRNMDKDHVGLWDASRSCIICQECNATHQIPPHNVMNVYTRLEGISESELQHNDCIEWVDNTPTSDEMTQMHNDRITWLETINKNYNSEWVYCMNKNMSDIRQEILAKRVIRRWRQRIVQNIKTKTAQILYNAVGLNIDAAIVLANQVKVF